MRKTKILSYNRLDNIAATLKANSVKGLNQKNTSTPNSPQKQNQPPQPDPGNGGTEFSGLEQVRTNRHPIQCYKCGGWGHVWKDCPSPGSIDWRRWKKIILPPQGRKIPLINKGAVKAGNGGRTGKNKIRKERR